MTLRDQHARDTIATALDRTLFVQAGAGTGKTTALVRRVVELVISGRLVSFGRLAAITFTENAAGQLRTRIRERLEDAAEDPARSAEQRERCSRALADFDDAAITTLHGFASRLLADHPLEAELPPGFRVDDEFRAALDFDRWWRELVDDLFDDPAAQECWRAALTLGVGPGQLRAVAQAFAANWDLLAAYPLAAPPLPGLAPERIRGPLEAAARYAGTGPVGDKLTAFLGQVLGPALLDLAAERTPLGRLAVLKDLNIKTNLGSAAAWTAAGGDKSEVIRLLDTACAERDRQCAEFGGAVLTALLAAVGTAVLDAADRRRRDGRLWFHDLLVLAVRVLRQDGDVRARMHQRWPVILVDEFQDTDPLQVELVHLIASGAAGSGWADHDVAGGALFFVGDPTQSIYRFRRADIDLYTRVGARYSDGRLALVANFRSRPGILAVVNAAFQQLIGAAPGAGPGPGAVPGPGAAPGVGPASSPYVPLTAARPEPPPGAGPQVLLLGGPHVSNTRIGAIRDTEAQHLASCLRRAKQEGWTVAGIRSEGRPISYADMAILVPTRTSLAQLEQALDQQDIPYRIESRSLIWSSDAVRDLVTILHAIDDASDQVALLSALRHPAFGCSDDDLVEWRGAGGRWSYYGPAPSSLPPEHRVATALAALRHYHERRWWLPVNILLDTLIRERRFVELTLVHRRPRDHWRRIRFLVDQARAFLDAGGAGLGPFVRWAREQIARAADAVETVVPETDDDAVRILTIHGAKGLEFPLVALTGLNTDEVARDPVIWQPAGPPEVRVKGYETAGFTQARAGDRAQQTAENLRLLYVAMTRAEDHLIVSLHHKAVSKGHAARNHAARLSAILGVLTAAGAECEAECPPPQPAPQPQAVAAAPAGDFLARRTEFLGSRAALLARVTATLPTSPSGLAAPGAPAPAAAATASTDEPADETADIDLAEAADAPLHAAAARSGATFGSAVHRALELIDLAGAGETEIEQAAGLAAGELLIAGRAPEVALRIRAALASEPVRAAAGARHWKEVPVVASIDGRYVEGYLDLLYETTDGLVVVDYKTDSVRSEAELAAKTAQYAPQLAAYRAAVTLATGRPVSATRLLFLGADGARAVDVA